MTTPEPRTAPAATQPLRALAERVLSRCAEDDNGCWLWTGHKTTNGYCQVQSAKRSYSGHRLTYEYLVGPIPPGLELDHLCRVRHCQNPWHLEPVTHQENVLRGQSPSLVGQANREKVACKRGHEFTPENTGVTNRRNRRCRRCHADRMREVRQTTRPAA